MEPVYGNLHDAQQRCEQELRAVREDGEQLEFRWVPGLNSPPTIWRMTVHTPKLQQFVGMGYTVVVVGSELDIVDGGSARL
jgi:hypothetical protein